MWLVFDAQVKVGDADIAEGWGLELHELVKVFASFPYFEFLLLAAKFVLDTRLIIECARHAVLRVPLNSGSLF